MWCWGWGHRRYVLFNTCRGGFLESLPHSGDASPKLGAINIHHMCLAKNTSYNRKSWKKRWPDTYQAKTRVQRKCSWIVLKMQTKQIYTNHVLKVKLVNHTRVFEKFEIKKKSSYFTNTNKRYFKGKSTNLQKLITSTSLSHDLVEH